jgi:hypothetical protein
MSNSCSKDTRKRASSKSRAAIRKNDSHFWDGRTRRYLRCKQAAITKPVIQLYAWHFDYLPAAQIAVFDAARAADEQAFHAITVRNLCFY